MSKPIKGEWYWVTDGWAVWAAEHQPSAAGGWTNVDTWEDWDQEVIAWVHIPKPNVDAVMREVERE